MKRTIIFLVITFLLLSLSLINVLANENFEEVLGVFEGTYTLGSDKRGVTLLIFMNGENCQAQFNFYEIKGGCRSDSGSYLMDVIFDEEAQTYSLNYSQWIEQPISYHMVSFCTTLLNDSLTGYMSADQIGYSYLNTDISLQKTSQTSFTYTGEHTHQLNNSSSTTVDKTCEKDGYTMGNCLICGNVFKFDIIPAGHQQTETIIDVQSTCTQAGKQHYVCAVCNNKIYSDIPIVAHKYGEWQKISGNKLIPPIVMEKSCTQCGDIQTHRDWSNIWITVLALLALIGASVGVVNYFKAFKNP